MTKNYIALKFICKLSININTFANSKTSKRFTEPNVITEINNALIDTQYLSFFSVEDHFVFVFYNQSVVY